MYCESLQFVLGTKFFCLYCLRRGMEETIHHKATMVSEIVMAVAMESPIRLHQAQDQGKQQKECSLIMHIHGKKPGQDALA